MKPTRITLRSMPMEFEVPRRIGPRDRRTIDRLMKVKATFAELATNADGEPGDFSHLADAVDALELLANLGRRMRASRPRKDGAS